MRLRKELGLTLSPVSLACQEWRHMQGIGRRRMKLRLLEEGSTASTRGAGIVDEPHESDLGRVMRSSQNPSSSPATQLIHCVPYGARAHWEKTSSKAGEL